MRGAISDDRPYRDSYSAPEVRFEEIIRDVSQARFGPTSLSGTWPRLRWPAPAHQSVTVAEIQGFGKLERVPSNPALTVTISSKPMEQESIHAFSHVDQADDPQAMVRFLETVAVEYLSKLNARSFALLQAAPGQRLLDLGCGNGRDACALAQVAGEDQVVGVDKSEAMLAEARHRAAEAGLKIEFRAGDAQHLKFDDASFDGVRCSRLLCHIADPVQALREMVRVLRPGGQLVCIEPDHETLVIASGDKECTRKIVNCFCDGFMQGWTGRMTPVWMREAGLHEVRVEAHTMQVSYEFLMHGLQIARTVQRAKDNPGRASRRMAQEPATSSAIRPLLCRHNALHGHGPKGMNQPRMLTPYRTNEGIPGSSVRGSRSIRIGI